MVISNTLLAIAIIFGSFLVIKKGIKQRKQNGFYRNYIIIPSMTILICVSLGLNTLGDNLEPLDGVKTIMCTTQNFDSKMSCLDEESCRMNSIVRLVLASVSLVFVTIPTGYSVLTLICKEGVTLCFSS